MEDKNLEPTSEERTFFILVLIGGMMVGFLLSLFLYELEEGSTFVKQFLLNKPKFEIGKCIVPEHLEEWQIDIEDIKVIINIGERNYQFKHIITTHEFVLNLKLEQPEYHKQRTRMIKTRTRPFIDVNKDYKLIECPQEFFTELNELKNGSKTTTKRDYCE